jgi:hypothetical protein
MGFGGTSVGSPLNVTAVCIPAFSLQRVEGAN